MKKLLLMLLLGISVNSFAQKDSWTGFIGDSHCGVKGNNADHASCAVKCIKDGAEPVLVVGDKVYKIADASKVADFVGKKVKIKGTLDGDTITVEKVKA